jgi:hypothetical protein
VDFRLLIGVLVESQLCFRGFRDLLRDLLRDLGEIISVSICFGVGYKSGFDRFVFDDVNKAFEGGSACYLTESGLLFRESVLSRYDPAD